MLYERYVASYDAAHALADGGHIILGDLTANLNGAVESFGYCIRHPYPAAGKELRYGLGQDKDQTL